LLVIGAGIALRIFFLGFARRKFFFIYFQPVVQAPTKFVSFARVMIRFCNA
jgi:hypothetical protein